MRSACHPYPPDHADENKYWLTTRSVAVVEYGSGMRQTAINVDLLRKANIFLKL